MTTCTPWNAVFPKRGCYPNKIKSGVSPQMSDPSVTDSARELNRMILRNVWQTAPKGTLNTKYGGKWANSSFRIVNNAGDVLSRQNYSCGGPNMVGSHPGMLNLTYGGGQSKKNCDGTGIPPSTCNVKYVYDSSDFIRYRKLKALNASYVSPDYTDGGANGLGNKNVKYSYDEVLDITPSNPFTQKFVVQNFSNYVLGKSLILANFTPDIKNYSAFISKLKSLNIQQIQEALGTSNLVQGFDLHLTSSTDSGSIGFQSKIGDVLFIDIVQAVINYQRLISRNSYQYTGISREKVALIISFQSNANITITSVPSIQPSDAGYYILQIDHVSNPTPSLTLRASTGEKSFFEEVKDVEYTEFNLPGGGPIANRDIYFLGEN